MKKPLLIILFLWMTAQARSQYWQQQVDYDIDVTLNEREKTLDAFERIRYHNNSPDTLYFIWFHLWPNAYKNDRTAFSDGLLESGNTRFYFSDKEQRGYINRLDFKVNGTTARAEDHPQYIDVVKLVLPKPLAPNSTINITTPFHVKLPFNFSRGGYDGNTFQVTQWYPKPAVYDRKGWHPMPYLDQGEFYSEFGTFDVHITLPQTYVVAATGQLLDESEKAWLKTRTVPVASKSPVAKKQGTQKTAAPVLSPVASKTLHYRQDRVHDFAWFANKDFIVATDTCGLPSGRVIEAYSFYTPGESTVWKNSLSFAKAAVRFYSTEVGEYPYNTVSVVQGPQSFGGGMEYPTITLISPMETAEELDVVIAHEVGHNWFYGILGSNEREHPWMDEGVNTFYERKYAKSRYGRTGEPVEESLFQTRAFYRKDSPITASSGGQDVVNYGLVTYHKTAEWLRSIEEKSGEARFREQMQRYFMEWKFRHPQPEDLNSYLAAAIPGDTALLPLQNSTGVLPGRTKKGIAFATLLYPRTMKVYNEIPTRQVIFFSPAAGINRYDKFMLGALLTNYRLPPSPIEFLAAPLYSFHAKRWNGLATISFTKVNRNNSRWGIGVGAMRFSMNEQRDTMDNKVFETFHRISPHLRYTFSQRPGSSREQWIEARSFFIGENNFSKYVIRSTDGLVYVDSLEETARYINQLTFSFADRRALYPYSYQLQVQQGNTFARLNATANYFFNYSKGGGFGVRLFAAKFFSTIDNSFANYRYQPKLLGVNGEEDYTYSNYFFGRTAFSALEGTAVQNGGLAAQQIMIRDGGLKMRMDAFEGLQGRSDNWVAAVNLSTSLPNKLLPFRLPLLLFFDIGTYAEPWEKKEGSRFLYVGGLQLSLFKNVVNVYAPLIYSADIRDNLKSLPEQNTFGKRLTFSINIQQIHLNQLTGYNLY